MHHRISWILSCLGCFGLMIYLIWPIYLKYVNYPTVNTIMETNYPVYNVEFPAVTICSNNRFIESYIERLLEDENGT